MNIRITTFVHITILDMAADIYREIIFHMHIFSSIRVMCLAYEDIKHNSNS